MLVLLFHCEPIACLVATRAKQSCTEAPLGLITAGHTGVSLFFVLSAFLLSLPFFRAAYGAEKPSLRQFYRRRALRILPLYWTVLVAAVALSPSWEMVLKTLPHLFFLNGFWSIPAPGTHTHVTWSLATEVQFYVLLPFLLHRPVGRPRLNMSVPILGVFLVAYAMVASGTFVRLMGVGSWRIGPTLLGRGPLFLCGIAAAWVYVRHAERLRAWRPLSHLGDVVLIASVVTLELMLRVVGREGFIKWETAPYLTWHVAEGVLWMIVLLVLVTAPLRLRALLVNRATIGLGVISYSIFLLHWPFLLWAAPSLISPRVVAAVGSPRPALYALAAVTVGLAAVTYRFIERPFLIRKARSGMTGPPSTQALRSVA